MMPTCKESELMLRQVGLQDKQSKQLLKCLFSEWSLARSGLSRIVDCTFNNVFFWMTFSYVDTVCGRPSYLLFMVAVCFQTSLT